MAGKALVNSAICLYNKGHESYTEALNSIKNFLLFLKDYEN